MAKIIKLTPEYLEEVKRDFEESLAGLKIADGKINFTKSFASINSKATVYFTEKAWQKQQALIREFSTEVGWHGVAFRGEDPDKNEYTITDILVYPQEVTGATVTTDQKKYQEWLMSHDDEVFNNIRMQGHSHVNMSTSPSGVDNSLYERILDQMEGSMFYIFLIYNKRGEKTYKIYDLDKNILFETADVTVKILGDGFDMDQFIRDAKGKVEEKKYTASQYNYSKPAATPAATASPSSGMTHLVEVTPKSAAPKADEKKSGGFSGLRYGKGNGGKYATGAKTYDSMYGYDDDPYSAFGYRDRWY